MTSVRQSIMSFNEICRLCLHKSTDLSSLFLDHRAEMLENLTLIEICEKDPCIQICPKCSFSLKLAYEIQQDIKRANGRLEEMLITGENLVEECDNTSRCLICQQQFVEEDADSDNKCSLARYFQDIKKICNVCNHQTFRVLSDYKRESVDCHQTSPAYKCEGCGRTFIHKTLYNVHINNIPLPPTPPPLQSPSSPEIATAEVSSNEQEVSIKTEENVKIEENDCHLENEPIAVKKRGRPRKKNQQQSDSPQDEKTVWVPKTAKKSGIKPEMKPAPRKVGRPQKPAPEGPFTCSQCDKVFDSYKTFQHHNHVKKPCPVCRKEYSAHNLNNHMRIHNAIREKHVCELCGATLTGRDSVRSHMRHVHVRDNYKCDRCGRMFPHKANRDAHVQREHEDNPEFVCDTCGRKFYAMRNLANHIKSVHLKLRPYECDVCKKRFSSTDALKTHKRQHTLEAPYKCELCGESFRQRVLVRLHRKSKHNVVEEVAATCKKCGKGFSSEWALKCHVSAVCF